MCDCCQNQCSQDDSGSFIFGIVFGLIIASIVTVLIYRQDKGKTFDILGKKLGEVFKEFTTEKHQKIVKKTTKK